MGESARRVRARLRKAVIRPVLRWALRISPAPALEKIGSGYGGWIVPTDLVTSSWICYDAGVGEDLSFATGMIRRFGCEVFAFDPTPRAIAYATPLAHEQKGLTFLPYGVWSADQRLRFFAPRNDAHVSHSVANLQRTTSFFWADCRSLRSLMAELQHERIDLLKLDIEGAEYDVLASALEERLRPSVICVEFDQPANPVRTWRMARRICRNGYAVRAMDGWNVTFVRCVEAA